MYGLPDDFTLSSFSGARLAQVAIGQHQVQLNFDGTNRSVSVESRYATAEPGRARQEFIDMPAGAAQLAALVGADPDDVSCASYGTLMLSFATGARVVVFDDDTESYQIHDGDRLIVV